MSINRLSTRFSLVDTEDSMFFLPLLTPEGIEAQIPYISSETGRFIIHLLSKGERTDDEIIAAMEKEYDADHSVLLEDLEIFLRSLVEMGVIERE